MSKQERRVKASKAADQKAAEVVEAAIAKVTAPEAAEAVQKVRRGALSPEHAALSGAVKELRDKGVAWWQIGFELGLPGSADNVAQGKGGAAFARKIYKAAFGEVPRSQVRDGSRANREKHGDVKAIKAQRKMDRVAAVRSGEPVVRQDMTDEEVVEMFRGRVIGWHINLDDIDGNGPSFHEQEAGVHKRFVKVEVHGGKRCLAFREFDFNAPVQYRSIPGPTRVVRLQYIHTVR